MTTDNDLPSFSLPEVDDNEEGWGPAGIPDDVKDIPFAPFSKSDSLDKISNWTQSQQQRNRGRGRYQQQQFGVGTGQFQYKHEDDESSFSLVDNRPKPKKRFGRRPFVQQRRRPQWQTNRWNRNKNNKKNGKNGYRRWGYNSYNQTPDNKDPSVEISDDWKLEETIVFADLQKCGYYKVDTEAAENLAECGEVEMYNTAFDRTSPKNPVALQRFEKRQHFTATTSDDPVIQRLAAGKAGNVYATDTILGLLMACARSVNAWDLLVRKENGAIYFDKRPESKIDYLTVNENWNEMDSKVEKDNINHPEQLSREATLINHNFSQQILSGKEKETIKFSEPNPFIKALGQGHEPASTAYRYRKFTLESNEGNPINLVARCSIDGYNVRDGEKHLMTVRALNQFDSKLSGNVEWRQKLEQQTGAVFATEMKNNANKLARWTAEAVLSGSREFRIGFVSRTHSKNSFAHSILMTKRYKPESFAQSVSVKVNNMWSTLRYIITVIQGMDDGNYILVKDPNKSEMHLFNLDEQPDEPTQQPTEQEA